MTETTPGTNLSIEDGVAVVTLDYPPVNAMSPALMDGLYDALTCTFGPCRGDGPRPVMLGLFAGRADPLAKPASESA